MTRTSAHGSRCGARRGIAIVIAIIALAVIGTLVAAAHLAAIQAHRAGERRFRQAEALAAAEYGVERVAANAPLAAWRAMLPGATDSAGPWTVGAARVAVRITRLGDSLQPVVLLEGIGSAGNFGARRALRTTSLTLSISEGRFAPLGALTIGGPVSIGAGATIEGADLPPAGWSCSPGGAALPGVATADASTVSSGACGPGCLGGAPPVAQLAPAADSTTYLSFGELSWAQLAATARPVSPVALPAPVIDRIRNMSERIANALGLRDAAKIDLRVAPSGQIWFLSATALPSFDASGALFAASREHGLSYTQTILTVLKSAAQRAGRLATTGAYSRVRHPQYIGFVLIMTGFLLQWPTLVTLVMYPVLIVMYALLARREEKEMIDQFGDAYRRYRAAVPAFVPKLIAPRTTARQK